MVHLGVKCYLCRELFVPSIFFAFAQLAIGVQHSLVDGEGEGVLSAWADDERMESRAPADIMSTEGGG